MALLVINFRNLTVAKRGEVSSIHEDGTVLGSGSQTDYLVGQIDGPASAWERMVRARYTPEYKNLDADREALLQKAFDGALTKFTELPLAEARAKVKEAIGYEDDFDGPVWKQSDRVQKRRYYFDLDQLPQAKRDNLAARIPLINARNNAHRAMAHGMHALWPAIEGAASLQAAKDARDEVWLVGYSWDGIDYTDGLKAAIQAYYNAKAALEALIMAPVPIPGTVVDGVGQSALIIDRGEGVAPTP